MQTPTENFSVASTSFFFQTGGVNNAPYATTSIQSVMDAPVKKNKNQVKENLATSMPSPVFHHSIHSLFRSSSLGKKNKVMKPRESRLSEQSVETEGSLQSRRRPKEEFCTVESHAFPCEKAEHAAQAPGSREKQNHMLTKDESFLSQKTTQYVESDKASQPALGCSGRMCALPSTSLSSLFLSNINVPPYSSDLPTCRGNFSFHSGETANPVSNTTVPKSVLHSRSLRGPTPPQRRNTPKERHRQLLLALPPTSKVRVPAIRRRQPKDLPRLILPKEQKESLVHLSADTYWKIGRTSFCSSQKNSKRTKSAKHRLPGIDHSSKSCTLSVSPHFQRNPNSFRSGCSPPHKLYGNSHYSSRSHCFCEKRETCNSHPLPYESITKKRKTRLRVAHGKRNGANGDASKNVFKGLSGAQVYGESVKSSSLPFSSLRNSEKHPLGKLENTDENRDIEHYPCGFTDKMVPLKSLNSAKCLKDFLCCHKNASSVYSYRMHLMNVYLNEDVKYTMGDLNKQST